MDAITSSSATSISEAEKQEQARQMLWKPRKEDWLIMITVAVSQLMVALDSTILIPILPALTTDLDGTASEAFWSGTSYLLASAVFQPFIATISDIFGRRELFLPSILMFFIGSSVCGWSRHFAALLAGRVIQGIGGGGIMTTGSVIFADMVPLRQRPKYYNIVLSTWAIGTTLGPLIGGATVERSTWRWCFWLNLPICVIAFVMVIFLVKFSAPKPSMSTKILRVDWIGALLFIPSLTGFLMAISWGGIQFTWSNWHTIAPLAAGGSGLAATVCWERYGAREPFLTKSLFLNNSVILSYLCAMLQGIVLFMSFYYVPFYFAAVRHADPLVSGVNLLPALCCMLPSSAIVSALITRLGYYRIFIWSGWVLSTIGAGLFILFDRTTPSVIWAPACCILGLGMGMILSSTNFSAQICVEPENAGRAAVMYSFKRTMGMSLGVVIGGSAFQNFMRHELKVQNLPESIALNAEGYVRRLWDEDLTSRTVREAVLGAYVHRFKGLFEILTAICGLALMLSLFIKHFDPDRYLHSVPSSQR